MFMSPPVGASTTSVDERFASLESRILEGMAGGTVLLGGEFNAKVVTWVGCSSPGTLLRRVFQASGSRGPFTTALQDR
jgi:hypothetical protein